MPLLVFGGTKQDVWISSILATIMGLTGCYVIITLGLKYPSQTIIQYSQQILGKWLGKILGFIYICFFILTASLAARDFSELFLNYIMPRISICVFAGVIILTAAYALFNGITAIGRIAELFVPLIFFVIIFGILGNISNAHSLPSLEVNHSINILITDALMEVPSFGMAVSLLVIIPLLNEKTGAKRKIFLSIAIVGAATIFVASLVVAVLGPYLPTSVNYPFFLTFQQVQVAQSLSRFDTLFIVAWISTSFLTVSLFYYITVASIKQLLNTTNSRQFILPVGMMIFGISIYAFPTFHQFKQFLRLDQFGLIAIPLDFGIPLALLLISYIKDLYFQHNGRKLHG